MDVIVNGHFVPKVVKPWFDWNDSQRKKLDMTVLLKIKLSHRLIWMNFSRSHNAH